MLSAVLNDYHGCGCPHDYECRYGHNRYSSAHGYHFDDDDCALQGLDYFDS